MKAGSEISACCWAIGSAILFAVLAVWNFAAAVLLLLGLCALTLGSRYPKSALYVCLSAILFSVTAQQLLQVPYIDYVDETASLSIGAITILHLLRSRRSIRWPLPVLLFTVFVFVGVIGSLVRGVELTLLGAGVVLYAKAWLFAWATAQYDWNESDYRSIRRGVIAVVLLCAFCGLLNFVIPTQWAALLQTEGVVDVRYGLPSLLGPFTHPSIFGSILSLAAIAVLAERTVSSRSKAGLVVLVLAVLGAIMSFRRRLLFAIVVTLTTVRSLIKPVPSLIASGLTTGAILVAFWPEIYATAAGLYQDYIVNYRNQARSIISVDSFAVASQYFPFGAGFSRFGSVLAARYYSPEYSARGYQDIFGLTGTTGRGNFLTDTMWPGVLGESGYLGFACFASAILLMLFQFAKASRDSSIDEWKRVVALVGTGWSIHYLIDSIASPIYVSAPVFPFLFVAYGIFYSFTHENLEGPQVPETGATAARWRDLRDSLGPPQGWRAPSSVAAIAVIVAAASYISGLALINTTPQAKAFLYVTTSTSGRSDANYQINRVAVAKLSALENLVSNANGRALIAQQTPSAKRLAAEDFDISVDRVANSNVLVVNVEAAEPDTARNLADSAARQIAAYSLTSERFERRQADSTVEVKVLAPARIESARPALAISELATVCLFAGLLAGFVFLRRRPRRVANRKQLASGSGAPIIGELLRDGDNFLDPTLVTNTPNVRIVECLFRDSIPRHSVDRLLVGLSSGAATAAGCWMDARLGEPARSGSSTHPAGALTAVASRAVLGCANALIECETESGGSTEVYRVTGERGIQQLAESYDRVIILRQVDSENDLGQMVPDLCVVFCIYSETDLSTVQNLVSSRVGPVVLVGYERCSAGAEGKIR